MSDLARALLLCGFLPGERCSVAAIKDRQIQADCFDGPAQAEAFLAQFPGWNHYLCGNPVGGSVKGKPKAGDVSVARVLLVDVDPDPDEAAARACALQIAAWLDAETGQDPTVIDSGRGTQLWVRVDLADTERRDLLEAIRRRFKGVGYKIDATHNSDRLMRLPGSVNLKTGRTANVIHEGTGPALGRDALVSLRRVVGDPGPGGVLPDPGPLPGLTPPTEADLALVDLGGLRALWDDPSKDRSKRDFLLVLGVLKARGAPDAARRLLYAMPGSKAREDQRGDDYWMATLNSVHKFLEQEERLRAHALGLPEAAKDDPGAPFSDESLDALLVIRSGPREEWQRLRADLKKSKVPVATLDRNLDERLRERDRAPAPIVRFVAQDGKRVGWFRRSDDATWAPIDGGEVRSIFRSAGLEPDDEIERSTDFPWTLINRPFEPEDLPGRRWNKDAARLAVAPAEGPWPTWLAVLRHLGRSIDGPAREAGFRDGADYLLAWCAARVQRPSARTAYLFFHGPQEAGKSTLHEAFGALFTRGYVLATNALVNQSGFNGEVANAVLCAIEEVDLSDSRRTAHERVKTWVTGDRICVRAMYRPPIDYDNNTGWIQCANKRSYMPVLPGDTRITEIFVEVPESPIPKDELRAALATEAPAFLHQISTYVLPPSKGRLLVPALGTAGKAEQSDAARTDLEAWLDEGKYLELADDQLVAAFLEWLPAPFRGTWDRARVLRDLPPEARRARRLAGWLRGRTGAPPLGTLGLLACAPVGVREEWGSPVALGKGLAKIAPHLPWLMRQTIRGLDVWRVIGTDGVGGDGTPTTSDVPPPSPTI